SSLYPIKVDVIDRQPAVIFVYQSKARASNPGVFSYFKPPCHTPDKTSLAGSQLANKRTEFTAFQQFTEPGSPPDPLPGRPAQDTPRNHQAMSPTQHN